MNFNVGVVATERIKHAEHVHLEKSGSHAAAGNDGLPPNAEPLGTHAVAKQTTWTRVRLQA